MCGRKLSRTYWALLALWLLSLPLSQAAGDEAEALLMECVELLEATTNELENMTRELSAERSLRRELELWKSDAIIWMRGAETWQSEARTLISDQQKEIGTLTMQRNERDDRLRAIEISLTEYEREVRGRIWRTAGISGGAGFLVGVLIMALTGVYL